MASADNVALAQGCWHGIPPAIAFFSLLAEKRPRKPLAARHTIAGLRRNTGRGSKHKKGAWFAPPCLVALFLLRLPWAQAHPRDERNPLSAASSRPFLLTQLPGKKQEEGLSLRLL